MTTQSNTDIAALALRLSSGVLFLAHGWMKVSLFTIPGTVAFFESLGLPGFFAYLTILAELGGGLLLIAGIAVRLISLPLIAILLGSVWAHAGFGWTFSNEGGGWEFPLFWAVVQVVIALLGAGAYALRLPVIDRALGKFA
ncbi:DoxX family protein [Sulfitobacter sp. KE29]|uniref:DoxX family protein n=1 Tax=unclassified Sulfitobacter TaxID=196795 RepID=UPI0023E1D8FC|nr:MULTISPECIES: DoxX family protein [unclassified Sulfitobacter]MDF3418889.1 DoxX family protein [Sulfitobacter sp. Ks38]MDF3426371.1 DoxX family protein [Sulfitobacter sp. KE29]MDF3429952.1 DoxX family protein [Sulfitobacter sp. S46]MDF3444724.1 DoxX family protein [Sulfitobacter sp. KE31]MDF3548749.1 DoxX family protein [Sulfitobacter sp. KE28]